jgi:hypothetical protein
VSVGVKSLDRRDLLLTEDPDRSNLSVAISDMVKASPPFVKAAGNEGIRTGNPFTDGAVERVFRSR